MYRIIFIIIVIAIITVIIIMNNNNNNNNKPVDLEVIVAIFASWENRKEQMRPNGILLLLLFL